jgi:hypothetical protein
VIAGATAIFILYLAYFWWDMGHLRAFCAELRPGTPISQLYSIAQKHGVNTYLLKGDGAYSERTGQWTHYIPATSSVGANVCAIHHNKVTVISAEIEID